MPNLVQTLIRSLRLGITCLCLTLVPPETHGQDITSDLLVHWPLHEAGSEGQWMAFRESNSGETRHGFNGNPGVRFDGEGDTLAINAGGGVSDRLTLSAWVLPESFGRGINNIVAKSFGNTRPIAYQLYLNQGRPALRCNSNGAGGTPQDLDLVTENALLLGVWQHIAVTSDGTNVHFFVNGSLLQTFTETITFGGSWGYLYVGDGESDSFSSLGQGLEGKAFDVRVYNRALIQHDIDALHTNGPPPARLDSTYSGLWVGHADLNEVKEAASGTWATTPASFPETVLLHIDADGSLRMLQEAMLMKTRETPSTHVVVSHPDHVSLYDGITLRGTSMVGQRFSSSTIALSASSVALQGSNGAYAALITLPPDHPRNPFRHKYHPDLAIGRMVQRIVRFDIPTEDRPEDHSLTGVLSEQITGLHKDTLEARGPITFTRVSTSGQLR